MTLIKVKSKPSVKPRRFHLLYERVMALLILLNYIAVIFNLTYIPLRDFWLQGKAQIVFAKFHQPVDFILFKVDHLELKFPPKDPIRIIPPRVSEVVTTIYDPIKGIIPHRSTEAYLNLVEKLDQEVNQIQQQLTEDTKDFFQSPNSFPAKNQPVDQTNLDAILAQLRSDSAEIINTNPFLVANKTGTLEGIKNKMIRHVFGEKEEQYSAKEAFRKFWDKNYLFRDGLNSYSQEMEFFKHKIAPLIATNYYRPIGENGELVDNFSALDFPFEVLLFFEFLVRTWFIARRHSGLSWFGAMLWRWYDIFLFLPLLRWLRIIPLTTRLNQAKLINLKEIQKQISQGFVATIAGDITEVVVIRIINQFQGAVDNGFIEKWLDKREANPYIDLNDTNEIIEIIKLIIYIIAHQVLPDIQPEAEAFLKYNIDKALQNSSAYQRLKRIPGVQSLENQLTQQMTKQFYAAFSNTLVKMTEEDPKFDELISKLAKSFAHSMKSGLKSQRSIDRLESLINDLLEEIKVNYIQKLSQEDIEDILEQTRKLRQEKTQTFTLTSNEY